MTKIDKVELHEFQFEAVNLGLSANTNSIGGLSYEKGAKTPITKYAVEIFTEDGLQGRLRTELGCLSVCFWTNANASTNAHWL